ncbi:MAG: hypothetical protein ABEJ56_03190 [Candidatus Nanohaloarchaea archaeon]
MSVKAEIPVQAPLEQDYEAGNELYAGSLEDYPDPEAAIGEELDSIADKYDLPDYFDEVEVMNLESLPGANEGAVAATAHLPSLYSLEPIYDIWDTPEYDELVVGEDGEVYGLNIWDYDTVFLADEQKYLDAEPEEREMIDFHEHQHAIQYNGVQRYSIYLKWVIRLNLISIR